FTLYRTPTIDYNAVYVRYPDMHSPDNKLGNEYNLKLSWRLMTDFTLDARAAVFIAKDAYRILFDVKPGARIYEYSVTMTQKY
ncbi:MAG: hypothetical protein HY042_10430, partial [Spirochaetia bacterium]|nr:hypothetical protein [Spirochaetia bacterium]